MTEFWLSVSGVALVLLVVGKAYQFGYERGYADAEAYERTRAEEIAAAKAAGEI